MPIKLTLATLYRVFPHPLHTADHGKNGEAVYKFTMNKTAAATALPADLQERIIEQADNGTITVNVDPRTQTFWTALAAQLEIELVPEETTSKAITSDTGYDDPYEQD